MSYINNDLCSVVHLSVPIRRHMRGALLIAEDRCNMNQSNLGYSKASIIL